MNKVKKIIVVLIVIGVLGALLNQNEQNTQQKTDSPVNDTQTSASVTDTKAVDNTVANIKAVKSEFQTTSENQQIAKNYCYVVHAIGNCDDLIMRLDTPNKVEKIVGAEINSPKSPYADACMTGLIEAQNDKKLCSNAWQHFGCNGSVMPNLIQQSSSNNSNPILCKFNG